MNVTRKELNSKKLIKGNGINLLLLLSARSSIFLEKSIKKKKRKKNVQRRITPTPSPFRKPYPVREARSSFHTRSSSRATAGETYGNYDILDEARNKPTKKLERGGGGDGEPIRSSLFLFLSPSGCLRIIKHNGEISRGGRYPFGWAEGNNVSFRNRRSAFVHRGWRRRGWPASMHPITRLSRPSLIDAANVARLGKTSQPFPSTLMRIRFEIFNRLIFLQKRNAMIKMDQGKLNLNFIIFIYFFSFIELRKFVEIRKEDRDE